MVTTVLVVDDNPSIGIAVKEGLEDDPGGYNVFIAGSGEDCLQFLQLNTPPDVILLDIMMPGMSGWEVFDKLKEHNTWRNIPILFLTARTDQIARTAGKFLGNDYIEKPFEISDVKSRIEKVLTSKQHSKEVHGTQ